MERHLGIDGHQQPAMSLQPSYPTCARPPANVLARHAEPCRLEPPVNNQKTGQSRRTARSRFPSSGVGLRTEVRVAATAVRVVQLAVLERHLPEGRLGVAELHGAHRAAAAGLRGAHRLRGKVCVRRGCGGKLRPHQANALRMWQTRRGTQMLWRPFRQASSAAQSVDCVLCSPRSLQLPRMCSTSACDSEWLPHLAELRSKVVWILLCGALQQHVLQRLIVRGA